MFVSIYKLYPESFAFLFQRVFKLFAWKVFKMFVYKHTETVKYVKK